MKKTMSRIISALLVVAMICAMIPAALAASTTPTVKLYKDGSSAALAATDTVKIKLGATQKFKVTGTKAAADAANKYDWQNTWGDLATFARVVGDGSEVQLTGDKVGTFDLTVCAYDAEGNKMADNKASVKVVVYDEITAVTNPAAGTYTISQDADGKFDYTALESVKASGTTSGDPLDLDINWTRCEFLAAVDEWIAYGTAVIPEESADLYAFKSGITREVSLVVDVKTAPVITYTAPSKTTFTVDAGATQELKVEGVTCEGATITYQWKKGNAVIDGATTASYTATAGAEGTSTKYTLVITAVKDGATASKEVTFTLTVAKALELKLELDDSTIDVGDDTLLTATLYKDGAKHKVDTKTKVTFKITDSNDKGDTNLTTTGKYSYINVNRNYVTYGVTAYAKNSSVKIVATATYEGEDLTSNTVTLKISGEDEYDDDYVIEYDVESKDEFTLDASDFEDILNEEYRYDDLEYVKFDLSDATKYGSTYGEMYESSKSSADEVSSATKYDYDEIEDIEFRVGSKTTKYTIVVPFTVYGESTSHKVEGALYVYVNGGGSETGAGDVNYYVDKNDEVSLDADDFEEYLQDKYDDDDLEEVAFDIDEATKYGSSYGEIYEGSKTSDDEIDDGKYDYDEVNDMEFRAGSKSQEYIVKVPFTAYGEGTHKVTGDLYIYVNYDEEDETDGTGTIDADGETLKAIGVVSFLKPSSTASTLKKYHVEFKVSGGTLYVEKNGKKATSSTEFYFNPTNSKDNDIEDAFLVPNASASKVVLTYTLYYNGDKEETGKITLKVEDTEKVNFTDIPADVAAWASEGINYLYEEGIINGTGGTKFSPNANMTRADFVVMLYRVAGEPSVEGIKNPFADVVSGKYYYNAVLWANDKGIVNGKDTNKFAPNDNITRQQIAAILYRYAGSPATVGTLNAFSDKGTVDPYAQTALKWAVAEGIVNGSNGKLLPKANATRAQVAVMLYRYIVK